MVRAGDGVLNGRYHVLDAPLAKDQIPELWVGVDDYDVRYLIKLWSFEGESPDDYQRALWDSELRTLYRASSSPGAEETILVLKDAGVDRMARCFVMILEAVNSQGYRTLADALAERNRFSWLSNRGVEARRELWLGLQRIADGLKLLHDQNVLHRNVGPRSVFFDPDIGVSSFRLGGFEWSVRLGVPVAGAPDLDWSSPPEFFRRQEFGYRPETDWYAFGIFAVRCLLNVEPLDRMDPFQRHRAVVSQVQRATRELSELEQDLLLRIIAYDDERDRLTRSEVIRATIRDIVAELTKGTGLSRQDRPLVLIVNPRAPLELVDRAVEQGFDPDPQSGRPYHSFNPLDPMHVANLTTFIQRDLEEAQLFPVPNQGFYLLNGAKLILRIREFELTRETYATERTWELALCQGPGELRGSAEGPSCVVLPPGKVVVRTIDAVRRDRTIRQNAESWKPYLPTADRAVGLRTSLARLHDFIRLTNQLELLIRDAEIFRFRIVARDDSKPGLQRLAIAEAQRDRLPLSWLQVEGDMTGFLQAEIESGKRDCRLVVLTGPTQDALAIPGVPKADSWEVKNIDLERGIIFLERAGTTGAPPPDEGYIRTWGMFGQVDLIRRRTEAIRRLEKHSYLLRSLSAPGQVYMDTGALAELPHPLTTNMVDERKHAVIEDILRVRPIYTLQGPPGTGKTTLVAHLLRQILTDDPVAQVLITAQAHGAVDVLRARVRGEAFKGVPDEDQPLAIRLGVDDQTSPGGNNAAGKPMDGSKEAVSLGLLQLSHDRLSKLQSLTPLQEEWLRAADRMARALDTGTSDAEARDFCEVVRRGAHLTYCTTSAGDLEELARTTQSFDWAVVEEAGKAHGFDLALPLQAGHRWLLIGDQKQLPPYRFEDYQDGIENLDDAVAALDDLPGRAARLLDRDFIVGWWNRTPQEREDFKEYAREWLKTFQTLFQECETATGPRKTTVDTAAGAASGMLSRQYRMHPVIANVISAAFYEGKLESGTISSDGVLDAKVVHPFVRPAGIAGKALVWINTPWAAVDPSASELGPSQKRARYTNPVEVEALRALLAQFAPSDMDRGSPCQPLSLAILSPYSQQVNSELWTPGHK